MLHSCLSLTLYLIFFFSLYLTPVLSQGSAITFTVDTGDGLVYFLLILFFALVFFTPVMRWIYIKYLAIFVDKAQKEISKASKRFSDRMSDVSRKVSQSVRSV
jgi:hypothetical protein